MKKNFLFIPWVIFFFVITTGHVLADPNDVVVAPFEAKERVLTVVEMALARPLEMVLDAEKAVEPAVYPPAAYTYPFPFTGLEVFDVKKKVYKRYPWQLRKWGCSYSMCYI